jgi:hypothetical protein
VQITPLSISLLKNKTMDSETWEKCYRALAFYLSLHEAVEIANMIQDETSEIEDIEKRLQNFRDNSKREKEKQVQHA